MRTQTAPKSASNNLFSTNALRALHINKQIQKTVFLKNRIIQRKQSNSNSPSFILCQLLFSEKSRINAQTKKMGPLGPLILIRLEPILPLCPRHCRVDRKYRICSVFQTNQRERGQKTQLRSFIRTHWFKPFRQ